MKGAWQMNKGRLSALSALILTFLFVVGGWFLTRALLREKEAEIFRGQALVFEVSELVEQEVAAEELLEEDFAGVELTAEEMAKVLAVWEAGGNEIPHEPKGNQMDMEQAISAGQDWITSLAEGGALPEFLAGCSFGKTNARLCTYDMDVDLDESLISVWKVEFMKEDIEIKLNIHAASGQVWKADISMNEGRGLFGECTDEEVLKLAFPFLKQDGQTALSAKLHRVQTVVDGEVAVDELVLELLKL